MIKGFKENESRDSALIFNSTWEQIKKLHAVNPEQAGELAISAIELALTGEISSDDFMIDLLLENIKVVNERNQEKWNKKVETQKQKRIEDQKLDIIADLYSKGMKQKDIAARLETTPQTISNRLATIRADYPYLLTKNQVNQENQVNQVYDNVNDHVNDNVNDNVNYGEVCAVPAQALKGSACGKPQASLNYSSSSEEMYSKFRRESGF